MHMTDIHVTSNTPHWRWLAALIATATAAFFLLPAGTGMLTATAPVAAVPKADRMTPAPAASSAAIIDAQARAQQAALAATESPADTAIGERPDYVSEMEWQVLKGVAANSTDPERELGRLVAKLRFTRQLELWQAMSPQDARRDNLARRLLADIPDRVTNRDLDLHDARQLQQQLLEDTIADAVEREVRLEVEQQRLRVLITPHERAP